MKRLWLALAALVAVCAMAGQAAGAYLGAADASDRRAGVSAVKRSMPGSVAWDGTHLWVGESQVSSRILRFSLE